MTLSELKTLFTEKLNNQYETTEISSFYYWLVEAYLGLKRIDISLNPNHKLPKSDENRFIEALKRLEQDEPLQYILGETEFYGLQFSVNKHVLIPRPETETLVEWIIKDIGKISAAGKNQTLKLLDIGTGSGCIAVSLAKNLPHWQVSGLDVSENALKVAKTNAKQNEVEVNFFQQNILEWKAAGEQWDLIVSNPPYVRQLEKSEMRPNVLNYEPEQALFVADDDALLFYRKITAFAEKNLKPDGKLYFEINEYLGEQTRDLVTDFDFKKIELRKDYFGKFRMLKAIKR